MRLYKMQAGGRIEFAGSKAAAITQRLPLAAAAGVKKAGIEIVEVDVPTSKDGLIAFLNTLTPAA